MVTWKQIGLIGLGLLVVGLFLTYVPKIEVYGLYQLLHPQKISPAFYRRDVFAQEDRARQTLATILGGLAVLSGAALTLRSVRAAEKSAEVARDNAETARRVAEQNAETAQKNLKLSEDKLITDRFTAAVTNLSADGPEKMAQRLGGIYALERIARDSPDDHWTVMEVLTAYIRDKCRRDGPTRDENGDTIDPDLGKALTEKPPTDVQAILTVIGRRSSKNDDGRIIVLNSVSLTRADLDGATLDGADLIAANLIAASFICANLRSARLMAADLRHTDFTNSNLTAANLMGANMERTDLRKADLTGAYLGAAKLAGCRGLTQKQLDSANQDMAPVSLPPRLHFSARPAPDPPDSSPLTD